MSIRKSLAFSLVDRYASLIVNIVSTMLLARLLTPDDIGAFSVGMVFIALTSSFRDLGAGVYLAQVKELTEERIRAVWAVLLGLGMLLALLLFSLSWLAGKFYGDTRVRDVMLVSALGFAISPFGSITNAWLMREMRFGSTAVMRLSGTVTGAVTSVLLAWNGVGALSLAWGNLAAIVASASVASYFRPRNFPWLPSLRGAREVLAFGSRISGSSLVRSLAKNAPEAFLGKLQDFTAAAYYSRANGMVMLFNRLVTDAAGSVAESSFAKQNRESKDLKASFLVGTTHMLVLCWSFAGFMGFLAGPLIRVLYGNQWDNSIELTRWLSAALALAAPVQLCLSVLTGAGHAQLVLRAGLVTAALAIPLYLLGASLGLQFVGMVALVVEGLSAAYWLVITRRMLGFTWKQLAEPAWRSAFVSAASSVGPALIWSGFVPMPQQPLPVVIIGCCSAAAGFLVGAAIVRHPILIELRSILARMRMRMRPALRS